MPSVRRTSLIVSALWLDFSCNRQPGEAQRKSARVENPGPSQIVEKAAYPLPTGCQIAALVDFKRLSQVFGGRGSPLDVVPVAGKDVSSILAAAELDPLRDIDAGLLCKIDGAARTRPRLAILLVGRFKGHVLDRISAAHAGDVRRSIEGRPAVEVGGTWIAQRSPSELVIATDPELLARVLNASSSPYAFGSTTAASVVIGREAVQEAVSASGSGTQLDDLRAIEGVTFDVASDGSILRGRISTESRDAAARILQRAQVALAKLRASRDVGRVPPHVDVMALGATVSVTIPLPPQALQMFLGAVGARVGQRVKSDIARARL